MEDLRPFPHPGTGPASPSRLMVYPTTEREHYGTGANSEAKKSGACIEIIEKTACKIPHFCGVMELLAGRGCGWTLGSEAEGDGG